MKNLFIKNLFIIRGLPGSGKSTLANTICNEFSVVEADQYFVNKKTGEYTFDGSKIKNAHNWCQNEVEIRMQDNQVNEQFYPNIAVSNTFTQEWEMKPYFDLANKYGYRVFCIIAENRHEGKNLHGVPEDKLEIMKNRFEIKL